MTDSRSSQPSFGVVILTMGCRPMELERAIHSVQMQRDVRLDIVVVGNGWQPSDIPPGVKGLYLERNLGIPAGRNAGVSEVTGEFLLFLDDDSWLLDETFLLKSASRIRRDPGLGMIQPRIVDPQRRGEEPTRWIPRIRKGDPAESSAVFSVLETALVLKRETFDSTGGWPSDFFYAHEGIELAWRVWDQGLAVHYLGDLEVAHPVVEQTRHEEYYYMNARNRVWLARRCLPWPISWAYVASWTLVQLVRTRDRTVMRTWWRGWRDGWCKLPWIPGERPTKLSWRTVAMMTRQGRLPII